MFESGLLRQLLWMAAILNIVYYLLPYDRSHFSVLYLGLQWIRGLLVGLGSSPKGQLSPLTLWPAIIWISWVQWELYFQTRSGFGWLNKILIMNGSDYKRHSKLEDFSLVFRWLSNNPTLITQLINSDQSKWEQEKGLGIECKFYQMRLELECSEFKPPLYIKTL